MLKKQNFLYVFKYIVLYVRIIDICAAHLEPCSRILCKYSFQKTLVSIKSELTVDKISNTIGRCPTDTDSTARIGFTIKDPALTVDFEFKKVIFSFSFERLQL